MFDVLLLYCILLLDKNYRQYLVSYIIFIYIRLSAHHLKKPVPEVRYWRHREWVEEERN